jgi:hypothetical protein
MIGMAVSSGKATMTELCTSVGAERLYDMIEIIVVDSHNAKIARDKANKDAK